MKEIAPVNWPEYINEEILKKITIREIKVGIVLTVIVVFGYVMTVNLFDWQWLIKAEIENYKKFHQNKITLK